MATSAPNEEAKSEVQLREEENKALREELASLRAEELEAQSKSEDARKIARLDREKEALLTEIGYSKRLKANRLGVGVDELEGDKSNSSKAETPEVPATPSTPAETPAKTGKDK